MNSARLAALTEGRAPRGARLRAIHGAGASVGGLHRCRAALDSLRCHPPRALNRTAPANLSNQVSD
ncbi:MAG: hypothetical protein ABSB88_11900 [Bryobacteraceae bacterium]|jgi:hypothetical protein